MKVNSFVFLGFMVFALPSSAQSNADILRQMQDTMRQYQMQGGGHDQAPPPGFFTNGRDSAPPGFWDGNSGASGNAQQFQQNMQGIANGVRHAAELAEQGRRAAEAANAIPGGNGNGNGRAQRYGNAVVSPNGVVMQDRGQGYSNITTDGDVRTGRRGGGNRSEVMINGRRYMAVD